MSRQTFKQVRVIDPQSSTDQSCDLHVHNQNIVGFNDASFAADQEHSGEGLWLIPAAVDFGYRGDLRSLSAIGAELGAAARGGSAHLVMEPAGTSVIDDAAEVRDLKARAKHHDGARLHVIGAVSSNLEHKSLAAMSTLREAGCIAVGDGGQSIDDTNLLIRMLQYAQSLDLTVFLTPLDSRLANGCVHAGRVSTRLGLNGIPSSAETMGLARIIESVRATSARVHVMRLSTAEGVELVRNARREGLPITADVAIHHLYLTENDIGPFDARFHVQPPLRTLSDRDALLAGVVDGTIDVICSQHTPLGRDARLAPFAVTDPGIAGAQTLMPLVLQLVLDGRLPLDRAIDATSTQPATICKLNHATSLRPDDKATFCLIDPNDDGQIDSEHWHSLGHNSPFSDWVFRARVVSTWFKGRQIA